MIIVSYILDTYSHLIFKWNVLLDRQMHHAIILFTVSRQHFNVSVNEVIVLCVSQLILCEVHTNTHAYAFNTNKDCVNIDTMINSHTDLQVAWVRKPVNQFISLNVCPQRDLLIIMTVSITHTHTQHTSFAVRTFRIQYISIWIFHIHKGLGLSDSSQYFSLCKFWLEIVYVRNIFIIL